MKVIIILFLVIFTVFHGFAQSGDRPETGSPDQPGAGKEEAGDLTKAYKPEEFAPWMLDLRRGEIVFFGSLPISFFLVNFFYDSFRWAMVMNSPGYYSTVENPMSIDPADYAPFPFESPNKPVYNVDEKWGIVLGTLTVSLAVAVTDFIIGEIKGRDLYKE